MECGTMSEDRWYYHEKNRTDVEERELKDLLDECLAVFEGGECLEDFESSKNPLAPHWYYLLH